MRRGNGKRYPRFPVKIIEFESASFLQELPQIVCPTEETNRHSYVLGCSRDGHQLPRSVALKFFVAN